MLTILYHDHVLQFVGRLAGSPASQLMADTCYWTSDAAILHAELHLESTSVWVSLLHEALICLLLPLHIHYFSLGPRLSHKFCCCHVKVPDVELHLNFSLVTRPLCLIGHWALIIGAVRTWETTDGDMRLLEQSRRAGPDTRT